MEANARLSVAIDGCGRSSVTQMLAEAPLLLRETPTDSGDLCVHLVGGAAGPLGGDRLDFRIDVGAGAQLTMRSVAASLAQPSAVAHPSHAAVTAAIGDGASLDWWPEPLISVRGSRHVMSTSVALHGSSTLRWVDEVCLGRSGEPSGDLDVQQRITVDDVVLAAHRLTFGPDAASSGRHGRARAAITAIVHGPIALASASTLDGDVRAARFPVGERTNVWIALGDRHEALRSVLATLGLER